MPDHWHGLIELGAGKSLSSTMQRVKGATARIVGQSCTFDGSLWDKGFHDRPASRRIHRKGGPLHHRQSGAGRVGGRPHGLSLLGCLVP
ncbi:transposase [Rhodanobacter fulvus]|nr:transposase [Rhodanobacter fulvus]